MERSSVAVPSRKAQGSVVVWVRSVGGELKKWVGWSASPKQAVREAVVVPELVSSPGRRWRGGVRKGS